MRDDWIIAQDLYFHINRFYSLIPAANASDPSVAHREFAHNSAISPLPMENIPAFLHNIKSGRVSGTTLLITFPFAKFNHHMGYWAEVLAPVFSHLSLGAATQAANATNGQEQDGYIRTVLIPNMRRARVMSSPWVMTMIKVAVQAGAVPGGGSPRLLFWDDLEATPLYSWLIFDRVLHIYSRHKHPSGGGRGFVTPELADKFRLAVHDAVDIPAPIPGAPPPRTITYLMPSDGSGVENNKEVLAALHAAAAATGVDVAVRPYSPSASVPPASLVAVVSRTGLLIGRHAPILANALFLPPGAAVVEILPYNWDFAGLSEVYTNLTASAGAVGHVAWRAPSSDWMAYASASDARYSCWTPVECSSTHCLDAHTRASVKVNITGLREVVDDALRAVINREPGEELRKRFPWPSRTQLSGNSGLWWDRGG